MPKGVYDRRGRPRKPRQAKGGVSKPRDQQNHHPSDRGCELHPVSCLTCPFPVCRYDKPSVRQAPMRHRARELYETGLTLNEIARQLGIPYATAYDALRRPNRKQIRPRGLHPRPH